MLKYRDYDASLVVREEGIVTETDGWNFYSDVLCLMRMLRRREIGGFVIDKYTLTYTNEYLKWKKKNRDTFITGNTSHGEEYAPWREDVEFFEKSTHKTLKTYDDKLSYGVLVRDTPDYQFINNAVRDNLLSLETSVESEMNALFVTGDTSEEGGMNFVHALKWIGGLLALISLFGLVYEVYRISKHPPSSGRSSLSNDSLYPNINL